MSIWTIGVLGVLLLASGVATALKTAAKNDKAREMGYSLLRRWLGL